MPHPQRMLWLSASAQHGSAGLQGVDLVYQSNDPGKDHFIKRVESRNGIHTIEKAAELGYGSREYELIEITNE